MARKGKKHDGEDRTSRPPIDDLIDAGILHVEGPRQITSEDVLAAYGPNVETFPMSVLDELREEEATALTALCTSHVASEGAPPWHCVKCGKPFSSLAREFAKAEAEEVAAGGNEWGAVKLDGVWYDRLLKLASDAKQEPGPYVEMLIKRQWIASGPRARGNHD